MAPANVGFGFALRAAAERNGRKCGKGRVAWGVGHVARDTGTAGGKVDSFDGGCCGFHTFGTKNAIAVAVTIAIAMAGPSHEASLCVCWRVCGIKIKINASSLQRSSEHFELGATKTPTVPPCPLCHFQPENPKHCGLQVFVSSAWKS